VITAVASKMKAREMNFFAWDYNKAFPFLVKTNPVDFCFDNGMTIRLNCRPVSINCAPLAGVSVRFQEIRKD
jgi:hypothetical protein